LNATTRLLATAVLGGVGVTDIDGEDVVDEAVDLVGVDNTLDDDVAEDEGVLLVMVSPSIKLVMLIVNISAPVGDTTIDGNDVGAAVVVAGVVSTVLDEIGNEEVTEVTVNGGGSVVGGCGTTGNDTNDDDANDVAVVLLVAVVDEAIAEGVGAVNMAANELNPLRDKDDDDDDSDTDDDVDDNGNELVDDLALAIAVNAFDVAPSVLLPRINLAAVNIRSLSFAIRYIICLFVRPPNRELSDQRDGAVRIWVTSCQMSCAT
jgi:hypothetical protein